MLGTYSIDENGDTTLTDYGIYAVDDGELVFDKTVKAQAGYTITPQYGVCSAGSEIIPLPAGRRSGLRLTHLTIWKPPASPRAHPPHSGSRRSSARTGCSSCCSPCRSSTGSSISSDDGNLVRLGENLTAGISNGAIWALVAIGYTLVYGIVELINFAHGEVFMIGSFISASFFATIGLTKGDERRGAVLRSAAHARSSR